MTMTKHDEPKDFEGLKRSEDPKAVTHEAGTKATPREPLFPPPPGWDPPPPAVIPGQETDPAGMVSLMEDAGLLKRPEPPASAKPAADSKHPAAPEHSEDPKHAGKK